MAKVNVGFTGTQRGMTDAQYATCAALLRVLDHGEFHHGDCIGADDEAARLADAIGWVGVVHPPFHGAKRAFVEHYSRILPARDYLDRNHDIVDATDMLIATPGEFEEKLRSGTWATIRYAMKCRKDVHIIYPDGSLEPRNA